MSDDVYARVKWELSKEAYEEFEHLMDALDYDSAHELLVETFTLMSFVVDSFEKGKTVRLYGELPNIVCDYGPNHLNDLMRGMITDWHAEQVGPEKIKAYLDASDDWSLEGENTIPGEIWTCYGYVHESGEDTWVWMPDSKDVPGRMNLDPIQYIAEVEGRHELEMYLILMNTEMAGEEQACVHCGAPTPDPAGQAGGEPVCAECVDVVREWGKTEDNDG